MPTELDPLVHAPVRLALIAALLPSDELEFTVVRDQIGATDGNLATHAATLEKAGYLTIRKRFVGKKPQTLYRLTDTGRSAFDAYLAALDALLGGARPGTST